MTDRPATFASKFVLLAPFIIGYALIEAWGQVVFSASFFAQTSISDQLVKSIVGLLPPLILLLLSGRIRQLGLRRYREILYLFGIAASAGTGLLLFVMYGQLDAVWTKLVLSMLVAARVCLIVCWWERLATFKLNDMWVAIGAAIAVGTLFNLVLVFLPEILRNCMTVALPLFSTVLLPVRDRSDEAPADQSAYELQSGRLSLRRMMGAIPWMLVLVLGLVNIPSEALVYLEMIGDLGAPSDQSYLSVALTRMLVNLAAVCLAYIAVRINIGLTFFVIVPAIIIVSFLMALDIGMPYSIMHTVSRIGSEMVRYVVVYLLLSAVIRRHVPALFCFSFMLLIHYTGATLGTITAYALEDQHTIAAMLFMGILLAAMLLVIFDMQCHGPLSLHRNAGSSERMPGFDGERLSQTAGLPCTAGGVPENVCAHCANAPAASSCNTSDRQSVDVEEAFANCYGLTQREREVLNLWVRGRTAAYIEEKLCISKYTVKTHVNHIYEKTGVNSKEELISLVEGFETV